MKDYHISNIILLHYWWFQLQKSLIAEKNTWQKFSLVETSIDNLADATKH